MASMLTQIIKTRVRVRHSYYSSLERGEKDTHLLRISIALRINSQSPLEIHN